MNWTEVSIFTTTEGIEAVCGCLLNIGIGGFVVKDAQDFENFLNDKSANWDYIDDDLMGLKNCETSVTVYLPENAQGAENLISIKSELQRLKAFDEQKLFGRLEISLNNVKEEDWANNWKQYFKPLTVGEKLLIKPSWETYGKNDGRTILEIDPASSFGTGQHNTTQLCLEFLEKTISENDRILDLGCGSGILSIAAVLLGAGEVTAVDIEENAVNIAKENAQKNGISSDKYTAYCGNIISDIDLLNKIGGEYDIILANIVADVLIAMSPLFKKLLKPDGKLIMSGIISERQNEVVDAVKLNGFTLENAVEKELWAAVLMKPNS